MPEASISRIRPEDGTAINSKYPQWNYVIPLPTDSLMWSVGGATIEIFLLVGDAWAQIVSRYTTSECSVLDMGCGCGRTARVLINNKYIRRYIGFDVIAENVAWCKNFIQAREPQRFLFYHYDLYSREYNPTGCVSPHGFRFPCADRTVDVIFAASLFTHLLEVDARHYLSEIRRTLTPNGRAILSIHTKVSTGEQFCGTETRIDIDPEYFATMCSESSLQLVERIGDICGQDVFVLTSTS